MGTRKSPRTALCGSLVLTVAASASLCAQESTEISEIVITGSHIGRAETESASPVQVITQDELARTGKTTLGDYLQTLTAAGAGSLPKSFGDGFASGGSAISLRSLGSGSTLVLLNSRRIAPYGLADDGQKIFTDLSVIPLDAIERVEVLKDGASAIYGSDAIAGVVNVILKQKFTGLSARASYGLSGYGDGATPTAAVTGGFGDLNTDRYNVFLNVEATKSERIRVSDRSDRDWIGSGDLRPYGYDIYQSGIGSLLGYNLGGSASGSPAGLVRDPATSQFDGLPGCSQFSSVTPQDPNGGCLWDIGTFRDLVPEQKVVNVYSRGTVKFTDDLEGYMELGYGKKNSVFQSSPSGVTGTWWGPAGVVNASSGAGQAVVLAANHPDNPYGATARVRYSAFDVGPRVYDVDNEFTRTLFGLTGKFGAWSFDAGYSHSQTDLTEKFDGYLRYSVVKAALGDPSYSLYPYRIGDDAYLNTAALYAALSPTLYSYGTNKLDIVDARLSRNLWDLRGGALAFAAGTEYRRLQSELVPATYTTESDIIGLGYSAYDGTSNVMSGYVEIVAPVLPGVEVTGALRAEHYAGGDTATTPKLSLKWSPAEQLTVRGTYSEGFRAPNAAEMNGYFAAFVPGRDPVRCPGGTPIAGASTADCAKTIAVVTTPAPGGIEPEESKNYSFGIVLAPVPDTSLTIDLFEIRRKNEITTPSVAQAVAAGTTVRGDDILNGVPGTGSLSAVLTTYVNANSTTVRGTDVGARHRIALGDFGTLNLDLQWSHISQYKQVFDDGEVLEYAGTHGNCSISNCTGTPKNRINFAATWNRNDWSVSGIFNFRDRMRNVMFRGDDCAIFFENGDPAPTGCMLASFWTIDLSGRWQVSEPLELFGSVENLLDRVAPLDPLTNGAMNYNPLDYSGALGRFFTVGARYSFNFK